MVLATLLACLPCSAWSRTPCRGDTQTGELFRLELREVTVDGEPQNDLSAYEGYEVQLSNFVVVDAGTKPPTDYLTFEAEHTVEAASGSVETEIVVEYYLPE